MCEEYQKGQEFGSNESFFIKQKSELVPRKS